MHTVTDDPGVETCSRECRNGQVTVSDKWARDRAGIPQDADVVALALVAAMETSTYARWLTSHDPDRGDEPSRDTVDRMARYAAFTNTVYPCPSCAPTQFARFRNGCFAPNHQARGCRLCDDGAKRR